jgi:hypothetical protein
MRQRMKILLTLFAITAAWTIQAGAQAQNDLSLRQSLSSARSVALGDASVADIHDAGSAIWNPASLAFIESFSLTASTGLRTDNRLARAVATLPVLATEYHTAAIGVESAFLDSKDWSKKGGTMTGAGLSYALRLMNTFSIGMIYNYRNVEFQGARASSHTGGIGLMYSVIPSLTYGMSFTGFGSGIRVTRASDGRDVLEQDSNVPRSVTFGASWHYPATHDRPLVGLFLSNESISGESRLVYRLGTELYPWKFLVLRGGLVSGPVTAVGRAGIGIRTGYFTIDYAVASSVAAERMHYLTVSIPLQGQSQ